MRGISLLFILAVSVFISASGETAAAAFAQKAVPRALDYEQGKRPTLMDAQDDFTVEGWSELMKWLAGFIDDKGAPTGRSVFTATGEMIVRSSENGVTRLAIPGTLKQAQNLYGGTPFSATTYRVLVAVEVGGSPPKIHHLKTTTCVPAPCR